MFSILHYLFYCQHQFVQFFLLTMSSTTPTQGNNSAPRAAVFKRRKTPSQGTDSVPQTSIVSSNQAVSKRRKISNSFTKPLKIDSVRKERNQVFSTETLRELFKEAIEKRQEKTRFLNIYGKVMKTNRTPIEYWNKRHQRKSMYIRLLISLVDTEDIDVGLSKDEFKKSLIQKPFLTPLTVFDFDADTESDDNAPFENRYILMEDCTVKMRMSKGRPVFAITVDWKEKRHAVRETRFTADEVKKFMKGEAIVPVTLGSAHDNPNNVDLSEQSVDDA